MPPFCFFAAGAPSGQTGNCFLKRKIEEELYGHSLFVSALDSNFRLSTCVEEARAGLVHPYDSSHGQRLPGTIYFPAFRCSRHLHGTFASRLCRHVCTRLGPHRGSVGTH